MTQTLSVAAIGTAALVGIDIAVQRYVTAQNSHYVVFALGSLIARKVEPIYYSIIAYTAIKICTLLYGFWTKRAEEKLLENAQKDVRRCYRSLVEELKIELPRSSDLDDAATAHRVRLRLKWADPQVLIKADELFVASCLELRHRTAQLRREMETLTKSQKRLSIYYFTDYLTEGSSPLAIYRLIRGKLCFIVTPGRTFLDKYHIHSLGLETEGVEIFSQENSLEGRCRKVYNECIDSLAPLLHHLSQAHPFRDWAVRDDQPQPGLFRGDTSQNPFKICPEQPHYEGWSGNPARCLEK